MPRHGNTRSRTRPKHRAHRMSRRTRFQRKVDHLRGRGKHAQAQLAQADTASAEREAQPAHQ